jgi:hypothetical protein
VRKQKQQVTGKLLKPRMYLSKTNPECDSVSDNASGMKDTFLVQEHENRELTMLHNCDFIKKEWPSEEDLKGQCIQTD